MAVLITSTACPGLRRSWAQRRKKCSQMNRREARAPKSRTPRPQTRTSHYIRNEPGPSLGSKPLSRARHAWEGIWHYAPWPRRPFRQRPLEGAARWPCSASLLPTPWCRRRPRWVGADNGPRETATRQPNAGGRSGWHRHIARCWPASIPVTARPQEGCCVEGRRIGRRGLRRDSRPRSSRPRRGQGVCCFSPAWDQPPLFGICHSLPLLRAPGSGKSPSRQLESPASNRGLIALRYVISWRQSRRGRCENSL